MKKLNNYFLVGIAAVFLAGPPAFVNAQTAGGSDTQLQYNNAGSLDGISGLTYINSGPMPGLNFVDTGFFQTSINDGTYQSNLAQYSSAISLRAENNSVYPAVTSQIDMGYNNLTINGGGDGYFDFKNTLYILAANGLTLGGPSGINIRDYSSGAGATLDTSAITTGIYRTLSFPNEDGTFALGAGAPAGGCAQWDTTHTLKSTTVPCSSGGDTSSQPACDVTTRGMIWTVFETSGNDDYLQVCMRDAAGLYNWVTK